MLLLSVLSTIPIFYLLLFKSYVGIRKWLDHGNAEARQQSCGMWCANQSSLERVGGIQTAHHGPGITVKVSGQDYEFCGRIGLKDTYSTWQD